MKFYLSSMNYKVIAFSIFCSLFVFSCEEQVDELWDPVDPTEGLPAALGDWYADSIQLFTSCSRDTVDYDIIWYEDYTNFNLWLLSSDTFQLSIGQSANLKAVCEQGEGTWDPTTGCDNNDPLSMCFDSYEFNEYNGSTTACSQNFTLNGTWSSDEIASTLTLNMFPFCENGNANPGYMNSTECAASEYGTWIENMTRTFNYVKDPVTGNLTFEGGWFDADSSCVKFYMYSL